MPKTDFYTLKENTEQARLLFVCRLCEKAYGQGLPVYIQVNSADEAQEIDNLLWSFRPDSFIPHAITDVAAELGEDSVPVLIGHSGDCPVSGGLLINLAEEIPAFHQKFDRLVEIVINEEQVKTQSRIHWSYYREVGYDLDHHQV